MGQKEYVDRLRADYRKVFKTTAGKHVLMDIYVHSGGKSTSFSQNPFETAFNEGKRFVLLRILGNLHDSESQLRELFREHMEERIREESS